MRWDSLLSAAAAVAAVVDFAATSAVLVVSDVRAMRLPNRVVARGYIVQFLLLSGGCAAMGDWHVLARALLGSATLFALYCALAVGREMGAGDVKLAALVGLVLAVHGWASVWAGSVIAFVGAGCWVLCSARVRRRRESRRIAFAPWMLGGAWVVLAFPRVAESLSALGAAR